MMSDTHEYWSQHSAHLLYSPIFHGLNLIIFSQCKNQNSQKYSTFVENMSLLYSVEVASLKKCCIFLLILIFQYENFLRFLQAKSKTLKQNFKRDYFQGCQNRANYSCFNKLVNLIFSGFASLDVRSLDALLFTEKPLSNSKRETLQT